MSDLFSMIAIKPRRHTHGGICGKAARGYNDYTCGVYLKISVGWTAEQRDAINRRVVRNNSTFAKEARRLIDIGLRMDHQS